MGRGRGWFTRWGTPGPSGNGTYGIFGFGFDSDFDFDFDILGEVLVENSRVGGFERRKEGKRDSRIKLFGGARKGGGGN